MEKGRIIAGIGIAAVLLGVYYFLIANMAVVELEVTTDNKTLFKIYHRSDTDGWTERQVSPIVIVPDRHHYSFRLTDLRDVTRLRIDTSEKPATVIIHSLVLRQPGYGPVRIDSPEQFARLEAANDIAELHYDEGGITVRPAGGDPSLVYTMPQLVKEAHPIAEAFRMAALVGLGFLLASLIHSGRKDVRLVPVLLLVPVVLSGVMAGLSLYHQHPDEGVHVDAAQYYRDHHLPPRVGDEEILHTYSKYGVSRLHSGEIAYFFAGKFSRLLDPLQLPSHLSMRCFNLFLFALLLVLAVRSVDYRLLLIPLLLSPQIWYIFSYFNSEAFAVWIMFVVAYQVAVDTSLWNRLLAAPYGLGLVLKIPLLGLLFGLLLLVKLNFYFFALFLALYFLYRLYWGYTTLDKASLLAGFGVVAVAFSVFVAVRFADQYVNDFQKKDLILETREEYAEAMFKPSTPLDKKYLYLQMRERGVSAAELYHGGRWGEKIFRSSVGEYGYMTVAASFGYYDCMRYMTLTLLLVLVASALIVGRLEGASLFLLSFACSLALLAMAFYHAWSVDFQAQGRYLLPVLGMFGVLFLQLRRQLIHLPTILICVTIYGLSLYSFVFVALAGIDKVSWPLG